MSKPLTPSQARRKGWASRRTNVDWDVALDKFSAKYCKHHSDAWCELETAWCDGWSESL